MSGNLTPISEPVTKSSSSPIFTSFEESELIWEEFKAYLASDSFPPGNNDPIDLLLKEFANELALITFPPGIDYLPFDAESDLREIEYSLNNDPIKEMDSILEDSVDKNSPDDNFVDTLSEMFTDEHALDYSSPPLWDDYNDELLDLKTVNDNTYDDPFDSKEEKIKDSKILIDELDPPGSSDFLPFPKCDSVFYEDFSEVDALSSTNNKDKEFIPLFSGNYLIRALKLSKSLKFLKARWRFFLALMERTSEFWMFRVSISTPLTSSSMGGSGQAKLPKTSASIAPDFEASRARGFCPSFTRASNPQLHFWESQYPKVLSTNRLSLAYNNKRL
ncbi:hypothetical protein Tco_1170134 [Tanacetum coccineum]